MLVGGSQIEIKQKLKNRLMNGVRFVVVVVVVEVVVCQTFWEKARSCIDGKRKRVMAMQIESRELCLCFCVCESLKLKRNSAKVDFFWIHSLLVYAM